MKQTLLLTALACSLLSFHCASTTDTVHRRERLAIIKTWQVVYSSRIDPNLAPTYQSERVARSGKVKRNLEFPDMISLSLGNKFNVSLTKDTSDTSGQILFNAMEFASGGFKYIDVSLCDTRNAVLAKTRIWNDAEHDVFKLDDSFADYVESRTEQ